MKLDRYLVKQFFPIFFAALSMFIMLVLLIDLFVHLVRFLSNGAGALDILKNSLYYIPKSLLYALPVSLLFASAYTLGDLYTKNELTTVLCSGVPFWRFCIPLFVIGAASSVFSFYFEDTVAIPALRSKNELTRTILQTQNQESSSDVVIRTEGGRLIYTADYYDWYTQSLNGVSIVEIDEEDIFVSLIRAQKAEWTGEYWSFINPVVYAFRDGFLRPGPLGDTERYNEDPETFRRSSIAAEDLNAKDAAMLIRDLKDAGLPFHQAQADYYHRFSFSAVSFVVVFLSVTLGGRFKKNILLMTLLASLGTAVVYYVVEMLSMMSAKSGLIPAVAGAWMPVLICSFGGFFMLRHSKT